MPLTVRCRSGSRLPPGSAGRCPATGRGWLLLGKSAAEQFQPLRGSLRLHHQRLVDGAHAHPPRHVVAQAFVGGGGGRGHEGMGAWGHGGMGAWSDGGGCRSLRPGWVLGGPSGWRSCWDPFWCERAAAAANPAPGVVMPPQSPSSAEPMGRPRQHLGLIQRGNGQEHPLQPLPTRAAITSTTTESQRDAPVGLHRDHVDRQRLPERARVA